MLLIQLPANVWQPKMDKVLVFWHSVWPGYNYKGHFVNQFIHRWSASLTHCLWIKPLWYYGIFVSKSSNISKIKLQLVGMVLWNSTLRGHLMHQDSIYVGHCGQLREWANGWKICQFFPLCKSHFPLKNKMFK